MTVTGFGVHIKVASIEASRDFYERYLGLEPVFAYGSEEFRSSIPLPPESLAHDVYPGVTYGIFKETDSQDRVLLGRIEIAEGHVAVKDQSVFAEQITSPKVSAMINVSSLAALLEVSSIRPKHNPKHYYWGSLEMVLRDPDGWVVVLIADYSDEEAERIRRFMPVDVIAPGG